LVIDVEKRTTNNVHKKKKWKTYMTFTKVNMSLWLSFIGCQFQLMDVIVGVCEWWHELPCGMNGSYECYLFNILFLG
jgi:hypothetical protein